jgi:hypothetical protein
MHSHRQTHPIIKVKILKAGALNLYHTMFWNSQRERLPHGASSYRKVGYVRNVVFGILYSVVNDSQ